MAQEFEGDLAGAVFWGADLRGAMFRDVDLTDVSISHARVVNVDIDAFVDRIVINGVNVTEYVNARDQWYPLRSMLRPSDPEGMCTTWAALERAWANTVGRARTLPEPLLHESVDGEWSFVATVRHLVFAMDKWFTGPLLAAAFHAIGLPNRGSADFPWPDLNYGVAPSASEALAVHADQAAHFRAYLASVEGSDLNRQVEVLESGIHPLPRMHPHDLRGRVLAQPLRAAGPRQARSVAMRVSRWQCDIRADTALCHAL